MKFTDYSAVRVTTYVCPMCRGYHLERSWCHVCDGAGFIKKYELEYSQNIKIAARETK